MSQTRHRLVTRVEIIDDVGRVFTQHYKPGVIIDVQDEGRTLKLFATADRVPSDAGIAKSQSGAIDGNSQEREAYAAYRRGEISRAAWSSIAFPEPSDSQEERP